MKKVIAMRIGAFRLLVSVLLALGFAATATAAPGINSTYQYFGTENFAHMTANPVFRSLSYNQLQQLMESDGTFLVLFGGAWCPNTQAVIGQINDVANEYGVKTIYNFDWRIDGATMHLRDSKNTGAFLYVDFVNKYLSNIQVEYSADHTKDIAYPDKDGKAVAAARLQVPFLFLYNRAARDTKGSPAPIIASYEKMLLWDKDFQTGGKDDPAKIEAYKKEIRPLFDAVSTTSGSKKVATKLTYVDDLTLFAKGYNARAAGVTVIDQKDAPWVIRTVGYVELKKILESQGNYAIMFGGPWCPNTRAVIDVVNQYAKKFNIDTVYMWDTRVDGNIFHLRDSKNAYANLYVDLVNKYFPGISVEYGAMRERDISYTDKDGKVVAAPRLQVPYVFVYNKDWKDAAGNPKPILDQVELMYEWADMQSDYKDKDGKIGEHYKTYTAALDKLYLAFAAKVKK
jgi:thiol-disulfide isomerase/thioredoxin